MLSKSELLVVLDTQDNRDGIAEYSFSVYGDVGLPGRFCTALAEECRLALVEGQSEECRLALVRVEGQSRHSRPSDHFIYF